MWLDDKDIINIIYAGLPHVLENNKFIFQVLEISLS